MDAHVSLSLVQDESQDECQGVVGDRGDAHHRVRLSECESCLGDQESGVFSLNAMPDAGPGDFRLWLLSREPPQHLVRGNREREREREREKEKTTKKISSEGRPWLA